MKLLIAVIVLAAFLTFVAWFGSRIRPRSADEAANLSGLVSGGAGGGGL